MKYLVCLVILCFLLFSPVSAQQRWCGINNLYFQDLPSGVDGFHDLAIFASGNPQVDENVTIQNTDGVVLIDSYISALGSPGAGVTLHMGLRQYNIYGYVSSVSQPSYFTFNVSKYNVATGKETFFYNATSVPISSVTPALDRTAFVAQNLTTFSANERLLIRIGAYTTRNTPTTIHFLNQGTSPTYVQSGYFECGPEVAPDSGLALIIGGGLIAGMIGALIIIRRKQ